MNIFGWYFEFSCMHVLKCKNKESFDLVEFLASVSQVEFVARFPSNRRVFLRKSSHISRIVLCGNVTREFGHNYDGEERKLENKKKTTGLLSKAKTLNMQRIFWQISWPAIITLVPFRESGFRNPGNFCLESEILGFGIQNII